MFSVLLLRSPLLLLRHESVFSSASPPPTVKIADGVVNGFTLNGTNAFRSIPYAAPPIGNLRFHPPQPPLRWKTPLDGINYGPSCLQMGYTYDKVQPTDLNYTLSNSISIWPFAGYGRSKNRNPSEEWWFELIKKFTDNKINIYHFGYFKEPNLSNNKNFYHKLTNLDFFSQIKISLGSKVSLGTDSGSMWVLSAYSHPTITLLTNWYEGHNDNFTAALPININGDYIFKENGFNNLKIDEVYEKCINKGVSKINKVDQFINKFW